MNVLQLISAETGISFDRLVLIVRTADFRYKTYTIPKRTGGVRLIQHPARELKFLQRWIVEHVLDYAHVHPAATAYFRHASVRNNAAIHAHNRFFLKLDFADFFPSITIADVTNLLRKMSSNLPVALTEDDIDIIRRIVSREGHLTIGAPSSPIISNAIMYDFDEAMTQMASGVSCAYSRYADDLVFSTLVPKVLESLLPLVRNFLINTVSPRLQINEGKVAFTSKKRRVMVTGLVLDCRGEVSIGRKAKRRIKGLVHKFRMGVLDLGTVSYLKGYLGYIKGAEPKFYDALERKYGRDVLDSILHVQAIRLKPYDPLRLHQLFSTIVTRGSETS